MIDLWLTNCDYFGFYFIVQSDLMGQSNKDAQSWKFFCFKSHDQSYSTIWRHLHWKLTQDLILSLPSLKTKSFEGFVYKLRLFPANNGIWRKDVKKKFQMCHLEFNGFFVLFFSDKSINSIRISKLEAIQNL